MAEYSITYMGKLQAQQRPRHRMVVTKNGQIFSQTYEQKQSRDFKASLHLLAQDAVQKKNGKPLEGAVCLVLTIGVAMPQSMSKKQRALVEDGKLFPTKKPDVDNMLKAVMDALNGVVYFDDKQVVSVTVRKYYTEMDGLVVNVWEVNSEK